MNVNLKPVRKSDYPFLYEMLTERDERVNISHKKIPTYKEHVKFVMSKPYSRWYIILCDSQKLGSIYLTKQNEIGIFLKKEKRNHSISQKALEILMEKNPKKRYLANINPKNRKSMRFFVKNNFKLIQYTYELAK